MSVKGDNPDPSESDRAPPTHELHLPPMTLTAGNDSQLTGPYSLIPTPSYTVTTVRSGPLPSANEMAEYERAVPGTARWLLEQAALDAAHIRDMERGALKLAKRQTTLWHVVPAVVVTVAVVSSVAIAIFASPSAGATVLGATIASVLTAYLTGKPWQRSDNNDQSDENDAAEGPAQ